jgi:hypothetical protein
MMFPIILGIGNAFDAVNPILFLYMLSNGLDLSVYLIAQVIYNVSVLIR